MEAEQLDPRIGKACLKRRCLNLSDKMEPDRQQFGEIVSRQRPQLGPRPRGKNCVMFKEQ